MSTMESQSTELPSTGRGWIVYLYDLLKTALPEQEERIASALMSMMLVGKFKGKDLFSGKGEFSKPIIDKSELKFLEKAEISYGVSKTAIATFEDRVMYAKALACIVQKKLLLKNILPEEFKNLKELDIFHHLREIWEDEDTECLQVAKSLIEQKLDLDRNQKHVLIMLWGFWVLSSHENLTLNEIPCDIFLLKKILRAENCPTLTDFVNQK